MSGEQGDPPARIEECSGSVVVWLRGDIDVVAAPSLKAVVEQLDPAVDVVFDLSETSFVDSSGLTVFIRAYKRCASVTLRGVPAGTLRLLEVTGLDEMLSVLR